MGGRAMPRIRNIFVDPQVFLESDEPAEDGWLALVRVTGLVCDQI